MRNDKHNALVENSLCINRTETLFILFEGHEIQQNIFVLWKSLALLHGLVQFHSNISCIWYGIISAHKKILSVQILSAVCAWTTFGELWKYSEDWGIRLGH